MAIEKAVLDRLLAGRDPDEVLARGGLLGDLGKALSERIPNAERDAHRAGGPRPSASPCPGRGPRPGEACRPARASRVP